MKPIIYPYKMGSASAKALAKELNCRRVYPDRKYQPKHDHLVINWGCSQGPTTWPRNLLQRGYGQWLNPVVSVATAANKLTTLLALYDNVPVPEFSTTKEFAEHLFENTRRVYCRKSLTGHSGHGIIVAENVDELVDAPLYTAGIDGYRDEYRIHVFAGKVIDIQQKKKKLDADANTDVRNHDNGWIYAREGVELPEATLTHCIDAINTLQLDFGAVDIIVRRDSGEVFVLEINTAPGLEGTTLTKYVEAIKELL